MNKIVGKPYPLFEIIIQPIVDQLVSSCDVEALIVSIKEYKGCLFD